MTTFSQKLVDPSSSVSYSKTPGTSNLIKEVLMHNILRERRERLAALAAETIDLAKVSYKTLNLKLIMLIDFDHEIWPLL